MSGPILYRVDIEVTIYVLADDDDEAAYLAKDNVAEEVFMQSPLVKEVRRGDRIDPNWGDAYPWGGQGDKTVRELLDEIPVSDLELEGAGQLVALP